MSRAVWADIADDEDLGPWAPAAAQVAGADDAVALRAVVLAYLEARRAVRRLQEQIAELRAQLARERSRANAVGDALAIKFPTRWRVTLKRSSAHQAPLFLGVESGTSGMKALQDYSAGTRAHSKRGPRVDK